MSASQSNLSNPKYGYDFVVATTQAGINSGLFEYLSALPQQEVIACVIQLPGEQDKVTLDYLLSVSNNVNPFDIPDGTSYDSSLINSVNMANFVGAIKLTMGIPPGIPPSTLPPVVTLGASADSVLFTMYCSELQIVYNSTENRTWQVLTQPVNQAWGFTAKMSLGLVTLDPSLDTPYFTTFPDQKATLLAQIAGFDSEHCSLLQLLFDAGDTSLASIPANTGIDPNSALGGFMSNLKDMYFAQMTHFGEPFISVNIWNQYPDPQAVDLSLSNTTVAVGQVVDSTGALVPNPTPLQAQAMTLDLLCAVNGDALPAAAPFTWNWVDLADVGSMSGVIAINRTALATYYKKALLMNVVPLACLNATTSLFLDSDDSLQATFSLTNGYTPQTIVVPPTGPTVLTLHYDCPAGSHYAGSDFYAEFNIHTYYTCTVSVSGTTLTVQQGLVVYVYFKYDATVAEGDVVNRSIIDVYNLSVGEGGNIVAHDTSTTTDHAAQPDFGWFFNTFMSAKSQDVINQLETYANSVIPSALQSLPTQDIQGLVFPAGKSFLFNSVAFSANQDLIAELTFLASTAAAAPGTGTLAL